jgi:transglutaminase-like putative cysteine protease
MEGVSEDPYLRPTEFLDSDDPSVREFALAAAGRATTDREVAVNLYYAVRDGFQYDPYYLDLRRHGLKASSLVGKNRGYCVEKAVLLAAAARSVGIPSRLSFYIVKNHLAAERLHGLLEKDYLVFHGEAEMRLDGNWVKATPAFNRQLCDVLGVEPLEFDGRSDSIFQEYDRAGNIFMEYLHDYGAFDDLPYELYLSELRSHYPNIFGMLNGSLVLDFRKILSENDTFQMQNTR